MSALISGIKAAFSKGASKGLTKSGAAKPGWAKNNAGGADKMKGFGNKIKRNPGKSAAIGLGGAALGYYGYQSFAGGGAGAPTDTYGASGSGMSGGSMSPSGGYGGYY